MTSLIPPKTSARYIRQMANDRDVSKIADVRVGDGSASSNLSAGTEGSNRRVVLHHNVQVWRLMRVTQLVNQRAVLECRSNRQPVQFDENKANISWRYYICISISSWRTLSSVLFNYSQWAASSLMVYVQRTVRWSTMFNGQFIVGRSVPSVVDQFRLW